MKYGAHTSVADTHAQHLQDFSGFRVLVLLPRERVMWPRPGQYDQPEPKKHPLLGAPLDPLPQLMVKIPQGQVGVGGWVCWGWYVC